MTRSEQVGHGHKECAGSQSERITRVGIAHLFVAKSEEHQTLGLLLLSKNERFASADNAEMTVLGLGALKLEGDILRGLGLLAEHWLGLATETGLLGVVAALTLSSCGILALLVLGDLVDSVLSKLGAVAPELLWDVDLNSFVTHLNYKLTI